MKGRGVYPGAVHSGRADPKWHTRGLHDSCGQEGRYHRLCRVQPDSSRRSLRQCHVQPRIRPPFARPSKIASGNKIRRLQPPNPSSDNSATDPDQISLPNAIPLQYPPPCSPPILIHILLFSAALVLLQQTPIPNLPLPSAARSLDKPQLPFLVPITAHPVLTLV